MAARETRPLGDQFNAIRNGHGDARNVHRGARNVHGGARFLAADW